MPDQTLVDNIRKENYPLQIFTAFNNNKLAISITTKMISFIQDIYRSLEPSHFKGELIIFTTVDDSLLLEENDGIRFFDKNILINSTTGIICFQVFQNNDLPLMWQNIDLQRVFDEENILIYSYKYFKEFFYANKNKINIANPFNCASIYALQYHYLNEALLKYKEDKIRFSSCAIFQTCWFDANRIYFRNKPEDIMQKSLKEYLSSSLRGIDVVREYNLGASKPVDIRVYWKEANRAALIELKWLGQSKDDNDQLSTAYANGRGNDGLVQLKEYMDLENQDTPTCITKGYLIIIDGRRKGVNNNLSSINTEDGMHYKSQEITYFDENKYFESLIGFEKPIRMFATPICTK